jgi:CubicO group peptidase (beta-lactamase class C family)
MKVLIDPDTTSTSRPAARPITIRNLLTHTAGLGYTIITKGPLLDEYNRLGINPAAGQRVARARYARCAAGDLEEFANRAATLPLIADPGTKWSYSIGLDVMGRVIEVASGMPFDSSSTCASSPAQDAVELLDRATGEGRNPRHQLHGAQSVAIDQGATSVWLQPPSFPYGGAGLVMSARDYDRFLHMLQNGGELDGARMIKPETARLAMSDLLPPGVDRSTASRG